MNLDKLSLGDSFEVFAHWWLPLKPDDRVPGTLHFSPSSGAVLTLQGIFDHPDLTNAANFFTGAAFEAETVYGEQPDGEQITLSRVFVTQIGTTSSFHCDRILAGSYVSDEQKGRPSATLYSFENLDEWSCAEFLTAERSNQQSKTTYSFSNQPKQLLIIPKGENHPEIELTGMTAMKMSRNDAHLERKAFFRAIFETSDSEAILRLADEIGKLLTILIGKPTNLERINFKPEDGRTINIFFARIRKESSERIYAPQMAFSLLGLGNHAAPLFSLWLASMERMRSVYSTFFSTLQSQSFIDIKFQALAQCLEGFHRRNYGGLYLEPIEYDEIRECLMKAIPLQTKPDLKQRLSNTLKYGNEVSLRKRLKEMVNGLEPRTLEVLRIDSSFQSEVVDARNYYAHLDDANKPACIGNGKAIYYINQRLTALFLILVLKSLGIPEEDATKGVIKGRRFAE